MIQGGDVVMRPKKFWVGNHYGTALDGGLVAHTVWGKGKHISTLEEFAEGRPVSIERRPRTMIENLVIQQRAVADFGKPYCQRQQTASTT